MYDGALSLSPSLPALSGASLVLFEAGGAFTAIPQCDKKAHSNNTARRRAYDRLVALWAPARPSTGGAVAPVCPLGSAEAQTMGMRTIYWGRRGGCCVGPFRHLGRKITHARHLAQKFTTCRRRVPTSKQIRS